MDTGLERREYADMEWEQAIEHAKGLLDRKLISKGEFDRIVAQAESGRQTLKRSSLHERVSAAVDETAAKMKRHP